MTAHGRAVAAAATTLILLAGLAPGVAARRGTGDHRCECRAASTARPAVSRDGAPITSGSRVDCRPTRAGPRGALTARLSSSSPTPTRCDFASAATATYTFDVAGPDRVRLRAADVELDGAIVADAARPRFERRVRTGHGRADRVRRSLRGHLHARGHRVRRRHRLDDCRLGAYAGRLRDVEVDFAADADPWQVQLDDPGTVVLRHGRPTSRSRSCSASRSRRTRTGRWTYRSTRATGRRCARCAVPILRPRARSAPTRSRASS